MKKFLTSILLAIFMATAPAAAVAAGLKPTRSAIKSAVNAQSYASLLKRFNAGEKLSDHDAALLYYGSALQPGFNANKKYADINSVFTSGATDKAYEMCTHALASDPTNLWLLFKAFAAASVSSNHAYKAEAPKIQTKINNICDGIFNLCQGVSTESPYVVIRPTDVDEFLVKYLQPDKTLGRAKLGKLDAVKVQFNAIADPVIFYFSNF